MPQLDPSSYFSQIFWLTLTFLSLWFVMSWLIIPRISEVIEARRRKIDDYIQKAESINQKALSTLERYESALSKAKEQTKKQILQTKENAALEIEQKQAAFEHELTSKIAENEFAIAKDRKETLEAVDEVSVKSAAAILQKLNLANAHTQEQLDLLAKHKDF